MAITNDGGKTFQDFKTEEYMDANFNPFGTLLDKDFSFYQLQDEGDAFVYVEKYLVKKDIYTPRPLGYTRQDRPNCFLIKEVNFDDVGGGFATIQRHFARRPNSWFDYEKQDALLYDSTGGYRVYRVIDGQLRIVTDYVRAIGVNYDYGGGVNPVGFAHWGRNIGFYRRTMTFLCKAERYYLTLDELVEYESNDFKRSGKEWRYSSLYPDGLIDNTFTEISDGDGGTITFPDFIFFNEPRWSTEFEKVAGAIVCDKIAKWHGNLYEITRYTSPLVT